MSRNITNEPTIVIKRSRYEELLNAEFKCGLYRRTIELAGPDIQPLINIIEGDYTKALEKQNRSDEDKKPLLKNNLVSINKLLQ